MAKARHAMPPEVAQLSPDEVITRYIGRFRDKKGDWEAFEDAKIEGYRRAQHRFIGAGGSGKHDDPGVVPARGFTLSIMYVPPGQGNAPHTHEVEEVFLRPPRVSERLCRGRGGQPGEPHPGSVGMHRLPARRYPRLPEREPGAGLVSGHARPRPARCDGLCRRRALRAPRRAPRRLRGRPKMSRRPPAPSRHPRKSARACTHVQAAPCPSPPACGGRGRGPHRRRGRVRWVAPQVGVWGPPTSPRPSPPPRAERGILEL